MFRISAPERFALHPNRLIRSIISLVFFAGIFNGLSLSSANATSDGLVFFVRQNASVATSTLAKDEISASTPNYCGSATLSTINFSSWPSGVTCTFEASQSFASGFIKAPYSGMVTITSTADDGIQVQINDYVGINAWIDQGPTAYSMSIPMVAGNYYPIKIWYTNSYGGGSLNLSWRWSGQNTTTIPTGSYYQTINSFDSCPWKSGIGRNCPGSSALQIKQLTGTNTDGLYWIDLGDGSGAKATYSIMNSAHSGGGWMLAMKGSDTSTALGYDSAYWKNSTLLNETRPSRNNDENVDAKYLPFTSAKATDVMVIFPDYVASTYKGANPSSGDGFAWSENMASMRAWNSGDGLSYNVSQGGDPSGTSACAEYPSTMQTIFSNSSRCLIRGNKVNSSYSASSNTYDPIGNGLFFSQTDIRFFGFNYAGTSTGAQMYKARFGFGWNENGSTNEGSNDGTGGIGLKSDGMTITSGTKYGCCAVQGGIGGVNNNGGGSASETNFGFELFVKNTTTLTITGASSFRPQAGNTSTSSYTVDGANTPSFSLSPIISGLSIDSSSGVLTVSNSIAVGTYYETVTVVNALGASAVKPVTIQVIGKSGETDTAMTFTGTNYLASSSDTAFDVSGKTSFTLQAWVKPSDIAGGTSKIIVGKENQYSIYMSNGSFGWNMYGVAADGVGNVGEVISAAPARANEWQHVMLVRGGSNVYFYLNGQHVYTNSGLSASAYFTNTSNQFTIGGYASGQYFSGQIDQVFISGWAHASGGSLYSDYLKYQPTYADAIAAENIAHYDFNEGSGATVYNRKPGSGTTTDLTLNSGSNTWSSIESTTAYGPYTVNKFTRSYLTSTGGWKIPSGVTKVSALVVGGGGAGGTRSGGGGGAGGLIFSTSLSVTEGSYETITVGGGGIGRLAARGRDGFDSAFSNRVVAAGGGSGGGNIGTDNAFRIGNAGGSGGGSAGYGSASAGAGSGNFPSKSPSQGNSGGAAGALYAWPGGGGGGISSFGTGGVSAAVPGTNTGGKGGDGLLDPISGTSTCFATGGGGGVNGVNFTANAGKGGTCTGKGDSPNGGAGTTYPSTPTPASGNTGAGGGGSGWDNTSTDLLGGSGGSGVVIVRYLSQTKPIYNALPAVDTTTAGKTYSFVASGSASAPMVRSYLWQSSTDTGTSWSTIAGATTETYTTTTLETTTSGSRYKYRVVVTDTDTAGSLISDTSTSYLVINPRITISGTTSFSRSYGTDTSTATYTFANGTGTRTPTFSPNNRSGISWSSTSSSGATLTIGKFLTAGTYYETITVTDSVSAITNQMLTIVVTGGGTLVVQVDTATDLTYGTTGSFSPTSTITGLVNGDTATASNRVTYSYTYTSAGATCATGGSCSLGDVGPGGGIVFKVIGSTYYEAAPKTWYNSVAGYSNTTLPYCGDASNAFIDPRNPPSFTVVTSWGGGEQNTSAFRSYCPGGAINTLKKYETATSLSWFIPNLTELNGLVDYLATNSRGYTLLSQFETTTSGSYWTSNTSWDATWGWAIDSPYFTNGTWSNSGVSYNRQGAKFIPIRKFTSDASNPTSVSGITNAGTYVITPSALTLDLPASISNYTTPTYSPATVVVSKATQTKVSLVQNYSAAKGTPRTLIRIGGSGTGSRTETLTASSLAAGCSLSGLTLTVNPTTISSCDVITSQAFDTNYLADSSTVTVYLLEFVLNVPQGNVGGGGEIGLNGITLFETITAGAPPTLSILSYSGGVNTSLSFSGTGFESGSLVTFQDASGGEVTVSVSFSSSTSMSCTVPATAVSGPILVRNRIGFKRANFTVTP